MQKNSRQATARKRKMMSSTLTSRRSKTRFVDGAVTDLRDNGKPLLLRLIEERGFLTCAVDFEVRT